VFFLRYVDFLLDFLEKIRDNQSMEDTQGLIRRFIELRKNNGPTQAKFGRLIGVSDVTVSRIESEQIKINEKHIKLICGTLGINETWLKTGEGSVFTEEVPGQKRLLELFRQLTPEGRKMAINVIEAIVKTQIDQAWDEGAGIVQNESPEAPQEAKAAQNTETEKGERRADTSEKPV
jgi:transcriptional regulator with XRE-family HTH domain